MEAVTTLNPLELEAVLTWVDNFSLSRCKRKLNRDFSDGVLLAEILKLEFPNLVDLHNYSGCFAVQGKIDNWHMLDRKVLKKLQINLKPGEIEKLAKAELNCIEEVLFRVMKQVEHIKSSSSDCKSQGTKQTSNIMTVNAWQQIGDQLEQVPQKMIRLSVYDELLAKHEISVQKVKELQETINDLTIALDTKTQIIEDLTVQSEKKLKGGSFKNALAKFFKDE